MVWWFLSELDQSHFIIEHEKSHQATVRTSTASCMCMC